MASKNETIGKLDAILASIIDSFGAAAIEERLQMPARLKTARGEAFNEGYTVRDRELQPLIRESEHERDLLKSKQTELERRIISLSKQLAAGEQEFAKLKSERDKLKASQKQR
jgi:peptidoglycan hydrolase CwlO-like protein